MQITKLKITYELLSKRRIIIFGFIIAFSLYYLSNWVFSTDFFLNKIKKYGVLNHIIFVLRVYLLPETFTVFLIPILIKKYHQLFIQESIEISLVSVFRYQLYFLPFILFSYIIYAPPTLLLRALIYEFPNYSIEKIFQSYFIDAFFNLKVYTIYSVFVFIYVLFIINTSLIYDFLQDKIEYQILDNTPNMSDTPNVASIEKPPLTNTDSDKYIDSIKGRNNQGELIFPIAECLWFETLGGSGEYYVYHQKGKYKIGISLNDLELELEPSVFFRVNRQQIINLRYLKSFAYWQQGKYILRLNNTNASTVEFTMARARLKDLKQRLAGVFPSK